MQAFSPPASTPAGGSGPPRKKRKAEGGATSNKRLRNERAASVATDAPTPAAGAPTPGAGRGGSDEEDEDEAAAFGEAEKAERAETKKREVAMGGLLKHFTDEQYDRFEMQRRCGLNKKEVKALVNYVLGQSVGPNIVNSVRGFAKTFVGEMVESARRVQAAEGGEGPLLPDHFREAHRRMRRDAHAIGGSRKKLFAR